MINAAIITIGDEILIGQINDTNSTWLSKELNKLGIWVKYQLSIGDNVSDIKSILDYSTPGCDLIIFTGGLGPTRDDITKKTLADYFNLSLIRNEDVYNDVKSFFEKRGREMNVLNETQAMVPDGCTVMRNAHGTAPGMWFDEKTKVVSLPGVPYEMKLLFSEKVLPKIEQSFNLPTIIHKTLHTVGIGESNLSMIIENWEDHLPEHIKLAYLPRPGQVRLRLSAYGENKTSLQKELDSEVEKLKPLIKDFLFSETEQSLENTIGDILKRHKLTMVSAESCSGGYIAHKITSNAGCSEFYKGSIVAYSNSIKRDFLDVPVDILEKHGAVSQETIEIMAASARKKMKADIGIATSGIAGPGGGTADKPIGTIWIACATKDTVESKLLKLTENRSLNIELTFVHTLNLLRKRLQNMGLN